MTYTWEPDGLILSRSQISDDVNARMVAELAILRHEPGHAMFDLAPSTREIADDFVIKAAVEEALGADAILHFCRHVHTNTAYDQTLHQDDCCGFPWLPGPWAILFYYPQAVMPQNGPTQIRSLQGADIRAVGPAGIFVLMRHDLLHKGMGNKTPYKRFAVKCLYRAEL